MTVNISLKCVWKCLDWMLQKKIQRKFIVLEREDPEARPLLIQLSSGKLNRPWARGVPHAPPPQPYIYLVPLETLGCLDYEYNW